MKIEKRERDKKNAIMVDLGLNPANSFSDEDYETARGSTMSYQSSNSGCPTDFDEDERYNVPEPRYEDLPPIENEEVKLKEFSDDDSEDLDVNIEGTEELVTEPVAGDDSYTTNDEEMDEDIDYESFALEGFHEEELELDDFVNDEH